MQLKTAFVMDSFLLDEYRVPSCNISESAEVIRESRLSSLFSGGGGGGGGGYGGGGGNFVMSQSIIVLLVLFLPPNRFLPCSESRILS